jgi:preprotein translocase subunit SecY
VTASRIPNLFKIPELKEKILFTLLCLLLYRIGAHITVPGVDVNALTQFFSRQSGTLFGIYDMFVGGGLSRATVMALGIMPYISASIFW